MAMAEGMFFHFLYFFSSVPIANFDYLNPQESILISLSLVLSFNMLSILIQYRILDSLQATLPTPRNSAASTSPSCTPSSTSTRLQCLQ